MGGGTLLERRRFMTQQRDDCPYQRVEYLEVGSSSDGRPSINTEYYPKGIDYDIYFKFEALEPFSEQRTVFISQDNDKTTYQCFRGLIMGGNTIQLANANAPNNPSILTIAIGKVYEMALMGESRELLVNGSQVTSLPIAKSSEIEKRLILCNNEAGSRPMYFCRIFYFRLDKAGKKVFDLVPVRKGDEGLMYDRVSGKLFGNSGTGKFILGPDIS